MPGGRVVTPDEVTEGSETSHCLGLIFLPSTSYLESFLAKFDNKVPEQENKFKCFLKSNALQSKQLSILYHSVPRDVFLNTRYMEILA